MGFLVIFPILIIVLFLIIPLICYFVRIENKKLAKLCPTRAAGAQNCRYRRNRPVREQAMQRRQHPSPDGVYDRQGNIFTISDDAAVNNRYADFFYLEPNSEEAARIRSQLDKDDKDLPSYDEVMHLSSLAAATQTGPCGAPNIGVSTTSIATTDTMLTVPPYSETDPNAITIAPVTPASAASPNTHAAITNDTGIGTPLGAPSTSRAAATNIANTMTLVVANSASNTSV